MSPSRPSPVFRRSPRFICSPQSRQSPQNAANISSRTRLNQNVLPQSRRLSFGACDESVTLESINVISELSNMTHGITSMPNEAIPQRVNAVEAGSILPDLRRAQHNLVYSQALHSPESGFDSCQRQERPSEIRENAASEAGQF